MDEFMKKAQEVALEHKQVFSTDRGPIFSFDNAPIHQGANLQRLGLTGAKRAQLPPSSPDMHKCIEHVFGAITNAMSSSLHRNVALTTAAQYKAEVEKLFKTLITPKFVQRDVATLKDTYHAIRHEVGGDWPDKRLR